MFKSSLFISALAIASFSSPVLADKNMSQKEILNRLNALETEVQSLRRQLRDSGGTSTANDSAKDKGAYFSASAGIVSFDDVTSTDNDFNDSNIDGDFSGEIGLGYKFNENVRGEISYSVTAGENKDRADSNKWSAGWFETTSVFTSLYYDFTNDTKFTPYVGAGLGTTNIHTDMRRDADQLRFGYQGKLGASYDMSNSFDLFAEGVYQSTAESSLNEDTLDGISSFSTRLGTRYKF